MKTAHVPVGLIRSILSRNALFESKEDAQLALVSELSRKNKLAIDRAKRLASESRIANQRGETLAIEAEREANNFGLSAETERHIERLG